MVKVYNHQPLFVAKIDGTFTVIPFIGHYRFGDLYLGKYGRKAALLLVKWETQDDEWRSVSRKAISGFVP